jgi:hypothetical protein
LAARDGYDLRRSGGCHTPLDSPRWTVAVHRGADSTTLGVRVLHRAVNRPFYRRFLAQEILKFCVITPLSRVALSVKSNSHEFDTVAIGRYILRFHRRGFPLAGAHRRRCHSKWPEAGKAAQVQEGFNLPSRPLSIGESISRLISERTR